MLTNTEISCEKKEKRKNMKIRMVECSLGWQTPYTELPKDWQNEEFFLLNGLKLALPYHRPEELKEKYTQKQWEKLEDNTKIPKKHMVLKGDVLLTDSEYFKHHEKLTINRVIEKTIPVKPQRVVNLNVDLESILGVLGGNNNEEIIRDTTRGAEVSTSDLEKISKIYSKGGTGN